MSMRETALFLFTLLDDIDTAGDAAKGDDAAYRQMVERIHRRRFEVAASDGHTVTFNSDAAPAAYDLAEAKSWCEGFGLKWNEATAQEACTLFAELGLTNEQANRLVIFHAHRTAWLFNPPAYGWRARLGLALHFLFGRALPPFRQQEPR